MHPATAQHVTLHIPTYLRQPERRLPFLFRDDWMNAYPDTHDDILGGPKVRKAYAAIQLENEHLRLTILPELGGKLYSVFDKHANQESIYVPDCIKPGLIHRPGAWIPGGMEFNFPIGHHMRTMRPLPCTILKAGPDEAVALIERTCARTGLKMELRIGLKAGEARFTIDGDLFNPTALRHRWYQWTNVGCWAHAKWRFFSKAELYYTGATVNKYPIDDNGVDISWVKDRPMGCDSFMVAHREDFFGCYDYAREHGICHVAPWQQLQGKKYFTWGMEYREYDSEQNLCDDGRNYLEIQTGPMETQNDFSFLNPGEAQSFHATWIPYRTIGGIEWADRDLIFYVRDGATWLYAATTVAVDLSVGARRFKLRLNAGDAHKLPVTVKRGDRIAIAAGGTLRREFTYPLQGRQEPNGEKTWREKKYWKPLPDRPTAQDQYEYALRLSRGDSHPGAVKHYRLAVKADPALHAARFDLADALWHIGDFAGGAKELKALLKTPLRKQAALQLARQPEAEARFLAPVLQLPEGSSRDLALAERLAGYGGFDAALPLYKKLLKTDPRNYRVHYGLARYYAYVKPDLKQAVLHAETALKLLSNDRDLILELCPIFRLANRHDRVRDLILKAPKAVRELSIFQKMLAKAYFELGEDEACFAIGSTQTLHNWEGECDHADVYQDSALALLEKALAKGDRAAAQKYAKAASVLPKGLGILRRFLHQPKAGYWIGLAAERAGRASDAQKIWRDCITAFQKEREAMAFIYADFWRNWFNPHIAYLYALCAERLGDAKLLQDAIDLIEGPKPDARLRARLRNPKVLKRYKEQHRLRDACLAELRGDLKAARRGMEQALKNATETRVVRLHLAAIKRGKRYGE